MTTETELKLSVSPEDLRKVAQLPIVRQHLTGKPERRRVRNIYYDTPDFRLAHAALAFRIRRYQGDWLQTVKQGVNGDFGLFHRNEHEVGLPNEKPDFSMVPETFGPLHEAEIRERLAPVFETNFWRTTYLLELDNGSQVELAADSGEAISGEASAPISEVELELKRGLPETLFELAERIAESIDVRLAYQSKADTGYELAGRPSAEPSSSADAKLRDNMTTEDAFAAIAHACLRQIETNEEIILQGDNTEGVHQMRVGLRRLRSSLSVFSRVLPRCVTQPLRDKLSILTLPLAPARDWDVFIGEQVQSLIDAVPDQTDLESLKKAALTKRDESYRNLHQVLKSSEFNRTLLEVASWIASRKWRYSLSPDELAAFQGPLKNFVAEAGRRGHKRLLKKGRHLEKATDEALHELRIAIKKQRYTVEFFRPCLPAKATKRYLRALKTLQEELGHLNDIVTSDRLLAELSEPPGSGFLRGWQARGALNLRSHVIEKWGDFREAGKMWKKL